LNTGTGEFPAFGFASGGALFDSGSEDRMGLAVLWQIPRTLSSTETHDIRINLVAGAKVVRQHLFFSITQHLNPG